MLTLTERSWEQPASRSTWTSLRKLIEYGFPPQGSSEGSYWENTGAGSSLEKFLLTQLPSSSRSATGDSVKRCDSSSPCNWSWQKLHVFLTALAEHLLVLHWTPWASAGTCSADPGGLPMPDRACTTHRQGNRTHAYSSLLQMCISKHINKIKISCLGCGAILLCKCYKFTPTITFCSLLRKEWQFIKWFQSPLKDVCM